jgi:SAM-dependent methyltransferase
MKSTQQENGQTVYEQSKDPNPYDELPYRSFPIEWTAPERLAVVSRLHGGPRPPICHYRVLELGCGDGANLLPLAYYRRYADFVGIDGASTQVATAQARQLALNLPNVHFIRTDFLVANKKLSGQFDYILAHGVFSWVPMGVRDALFRLCAERLRLGGILYLNYNTRPGWNVRGMVREFLLAQTTGLGNLQHRAEAAQAAAATIIASLSADAHPYARLLANEFQFVCDNHVSYVAHEFLAPHNYAYWRSEFLGLAERFGLHYVADADFNYATGRISEDLAAKLLARGIVGRGLKDSTDLLCYRQLHSPILTRAPYQSYALGLNELDSWLVASCMKRCIVPDGINPMFEHPSGYRVETKNEVMRNGLETLQKVWPMGVPLGKVFADLSMVMDDVRLLHRNGLIDLRLEGPDCTMTRSPLNVLEGDWGGYATTPYHTREASSA